MRRLILRSFQSPGDILMLTAAVRELHRAHPGQFETDVRTSAAALWEQNPYLTPLEEGVKAVESLDMHYPLIHASNQRPYHFLHGYLQYLEQRLGLSIPATAFRGDVYLSDEERQIPWQPPHGPELPERYWIMMAGGKYDFTAKWWNPDSYQAVVDHFRDRIHFVQCGEAGHWHPPLTGVTNLVGKTSLREFVWLMHRAEGVVCPVTLAMHLAAAVPTHNGHPNRACVVLAGGREPPHWEAYPQHQFLHTIGQLDCCATGGCWKSRCQPVGDGDDKDRRERCERPVSIREGLVIPQCQELIRPEDVILVIERTLQGWDLSTGSKPAPVLGPRTPLPTPPPPATARTVKMRPRVLIQFRHGLGDAVQFTAVLRHLRHYHPDWEIDVAALRGKHSAFHGLCQRVFVLGEEGAARADYDHVYALEWHENRTPDGRWPNTKVTRCLLEVFQLSPLSDFCSYEMHICEEARQAARDYLSSIAGAPDTNGRYRAALIHYEGNTSSHRKNLTTELIRQICALLQDRGVVPVILDWDRRSPLPDQRQIFCPGADHALWRGTGTGDAEQLAALIESAALMIGIDSGPLHVAGATSTPTIGVWTQHHPLHFFDRAPNVLHLVPENHAVKVPHAGGLTYFAQHYRSKIYEDVSVGLLHEVAQHFAPAGRPINPSAPLPKPLNATGYTEQYYREHRETGLDYLGHGEWQGCYGRWLVDVLEWKGKRLLDVGCACGSIVRGFGEAGTVVQGVDLCEHMIQLGRAKWPDMAALLHVCDAVNLHLFPDGTWDALHSAQVAEHWKPELVPFILRELRRVIVPGGLFFCSLDTEELFARQGRKMEDEDPTHICIRPLTWWHDQLHAAGWEVVSDDVGPGLRQHSESFLPKYDWDWFVARALPSGA